MYRGIKPDKFSREAVKVVYSTMRNNNLGWQKGVNCMFRA